MASENAENMVVPSSSGEENKALQTPTKRNPQQNKNKNKKRKHDEEEDDDDDMEWVPSQQQSGAIKKVWSDKDEITLLEVLKKRRDKYDMTKLYDIVKPQLDFEFSKSQVTQKVGRFKAKFDKKSDTSAAIGHDGRIQKLCEVIWGEGAAMTLKDFEARYPGINAGIDTMPPYNLMTEEGKGLIRQCMLYITPKELDDLEDGWGAYYREEVERAAQLMLLGNKQSELLQKGRTTYNQAN